MTSPKLHYLIELAKLIGRLGYSLDAGDTSAYLGILHQIKGLTEHSIRANTPHAPFRVVDILEDSDDDEL
jgi:hypothetical protein